MKRIPNLMFGAMVLITANSFADTTGRHPAYLHARTDLRRAERLMAVREDANVMRGLATAAHEAREAIHELDQAASWDRKDLVDDPPVGYLSQPAGPIPRNIAIPVRAARRDIVREEDNPAARALRNRALHHIDESIRLVRLVAREDWRDDWLR